MHRRTYCGLTSFAVIGLFLPLAGCSSPDPDLAQTLSLPYSLATFSEPATIEALGKAYLEMTPEENASKTLMDLLLSDGENKEIPPTTDSMKMVLQQKIKSDFESGNTIIVSGWVLSITEARQCALYSLTNHN